MDVLSNCALPAEGLVWQPRAGLWALTVVCKATFMLQPGDAQLASNQEPLNEEDNHWDDDAARSLQTATDFAPMKPRADVVLVGNAYAPGRVPVRSLVARLVVGDLDKSIEVFADRAFGPDGALQEGPRFARMPIVYERAAGGAESWNPVGVRREARDKLGKLILPNLQPPGTKINAPGDVIEPIGFGPLAPTWPVRRDRLGFSAARFPTRDWMQKPLPEGLDPSYFNAAPVDQQLTALRENESIVLENLNAEHPILRTRLPGLRPRAVLEGRKTGPQLLPMRADMLWIDADRALCTLTWRAQISLEHPQEHGRVLIEIDQGAQASAWPQASHGAQRQTPPPPPPPRKPMNTFIPTSGPDDIGSAASAVLPFSKAAQSAPPRDERAGQPATGLPFVAPESSTNPPSSGLPFMAPPPERAPQPTIGLPFMAPPAPPPPPTPSAPGSAPRHPTDSSPGWGSSPPATPPPLPSQPRSAPASPPSPSSPSWPAATPPPPTAQSSADTGAFRPLAPPPLVRDAQNTPVNKSPWSVGDGRAPDAKAPMTMGQRVASSSAPFTPVSPSSKPAEPAARPIAALDPNAASAVDTKSAAMMGGALGASNAAATAAAAAAASAASAAAEPPPPPPREAPAPFVIPSIRIEAREALHLIWYDPESLPRIRRKPQWRIVLDELERTPLDSDMDDPALAKDPMEVEDRREAFEVLARGQQTDDMGVQEALAWAVRDDGKFVPPLVLITGELTFPFDDLEALRATVSTVTPLVAGDERLKAAVADAKDFLNTPDLMSAPAVAEGMTNRIKDAFGQGKRMVPPGYLEAQTERVLLEKRHYQRRDVFGGRCIRALFTQVGSSSAVPTYLPDDIARKLPLYQRFKARLIAEVHLAVDQYESHPAALKVVALGRLGVAPRR